MYCLDIMTERPIRPGSGRAYVRDRFIGICDRLNVPIICRDCVHCFIGLAAIEENLDKRTQKHGYDQNLEGYHPKSWLLLYRMKLATVSAGCMVEDGDMFGIGQFEDTFALNMRLDPDTGRYVHTDDPICHEEGDVTIEVGLDIAKKEFGDIPIDPAAEQRKELEFEEAMLEYAELEKERKR